MDKKNILIYSVFSVILCFTLIELFFVLYLHTSSLQKVATKSTNNSAQTYIDSSGIVDFYKTYPGYFLISNSKDKFLLAAKILNAYSDTPNNKKVDISFALNNNKNILVSQSIQIPEDGFLLIKQNISTLFPYPPHVKDTFVNALDEINTFLRYKDSLLLFHFLLSTPHSTQIDKKLFDCNNAFLLHLEFSTPMPNCLPYTSQAQVYENF